MAMNDLLAALQQFDSGAKELAVGRAVRSASEQAQMLNQMEGDEFDKRQQFMQLGNQLAQQLSAVGANPAQVAQASQSFMPQQLQGPQDFFQAAATTQDKAAAQKYQAAGQQIQAGLANAPLTRAQEEQFKIQKMGLLNERLNSVMAGGKIKDEDILSLSDRKQIETLATKQGGKLSITNNLQQLIDMWPSLSPSERLQQGREIMKTLNSSEGADAVGAEEVKRLGARLEFALGNFTNSNETQFGRDIDGFFKDVQNTTKRLQKSVEANDASISRIYKKYGKEIPVMKQTQDDVTAVDDAKMTALQKAKGLSPEQLARLKQVLEKKNNK